jgi:hypothetical protein
MYLVETDRPDSVSIQDLKLVVSAQVPVWITWEQKRASTCLRRLEALGHVRVSQGERSREEKPPPRPRAQHVRLSRPQNKAPPPEPPEQTFTKADLDAAVAQAATQASRQTAAMFLDQVKALFPSMAPVPTAPAPLDTGAIEAAVAKALANATLATPARISAASAAPRDPSEPLFIPTGIVGNDDTELTIEAESTEDAGLADAADQLKKLRRSKKNKE